MKRPRTRAERTTHSAHFTWIESADGTYWSGQRNHLAVVEIGPDPAGLSRLRLISRLPGHLVYSKRVGSVTEGKRAADALFEGWTVMMGLSITGTANPHE